MCPFCERQDCVEYAREYIELEDGTELQLYYCEFCRKSWFENKKESTYVSR